MVESQDLAKMWPFSWEFQIIIKVTEASEFMKNGERIVVCISITKDKTDTQERAKGP